MERLGKVGEPKRGQRMGRDRKPKAVHERNGTFEKHPDRAAAYENEPKPDGPLGPPPESWRRHPKAGRALALFEAGKSTNEVAAELELEWDVAKTIREDAKSKKKEELLDIWHEIVDQAPPGVLTSSDRMHVEMTCRLIYRIRFEEPLAGDYSRVKEYLGKMAMNPADRPKVQVNAGGAAAAPKSSDGHPQANTFEQLRQEGSRQEGSKRDRVN